MEPWQRGTAPRQPSCVQFLTRDPLLIVKPWIEEGLAECNIWSKGWKKHLKAEKNIWWRKINLETFVGGGAANQLHAAVHWTLRPEEDYKWYFL